MNPTVKVSLIYARSLNGVIGNNNELPAWKIPGDLKRFKELTMGGIVVMGYKTWMSLPDKSRPLSGRINVVITTRQGLQSEESEGLFFAHSIDEAKELLVQLQEKAEIPVWVIGGSSIYKAFESDAEYVYETVFMAHVDGDVEYTFSDPYRRLESESVTQGTFNGRSYNTFQRVWKTQPWHDVTYVGRHMRIRASQYPYIGGDPSRLTSYLPRDHRKYLTPELEDLMLDTRARITNSAAAELKRAGETLAAIADRQVATRAGGSTAPTL